VKETMESKKFQWRLVPQWPLWWASLGAHCQSKVFLQHLLGKWPSLRYSSIPPPCPMMPGTLNRYLKVRSIFTKECPWLWD
jgi:hypothetical protein